MNMILIVLILALYFRIFFYRKKQQQYWERPFLGRTGLSIFVALHVQIAFELNVQLLTWFAVSLSRTPAFAWDGPGSGGLGGVYQDLDHLICLFIGRIFKIGWGGGADCYMVAMVTIHMQINIIRTSGHQGEIWWVGSFV